MFFIKGREDGFFLGEVEWGNRKTLLDLCFDKCKIK